MKRIIRFTLPLYRSSDLTGVFIVGEDGWKKINELIADKKDIYFGEVAGKHSEVICPISDDNIEMLSDDPKEVAFFEKLFPKGVGNNVLHFETEDER